MDWILALWIGLAILLFCLEFLHTGLILVFFSIGAAVAAMLVWTDSLPLELGAFSIVSILSLVLFRTKLRDRLWLNQAKDQIPTENPMDALRGKSAKVIREIQPDLDGRVEIQGTEWTAKSKSIHPNNSIVQIIDIDGISLIVQSTTQGEKP